jgi:signal transduction histidine kinase
MVDFHITCDESLELNSYPGAYAQIFTNLLLNSFIHGFDEKQKGIISIQISAVNKVLKISYSDDGSGISKTDLPHIFEPFFTSEKHQGTGLGLNIVYNLVKQKLDGTISCESDSGKGVLFFIEIPIHE